MTEHRASSFSSWIKDALTQRGWNQSDLAREINTRPSVISKWVNGHQNPEIEQCNRMAQAFRLPPVHVYHIAGHDWLNHEVPRDEDMIYDEISSIVRAIPKHLLPSIRTMLRALADQEA